MTARDPGASDVLTVGATRRPAGDGVACQQAGPDHDRRIGRVRARGDRRDRDRAGVDVDGLAADRDLEGWIRSAIEGGAVVGDRFGRPVDGQVRADRREGRRVGRGKRLDRRRRDGVAVERLLGRRERLHQALGVIRAEVLAQRLERYPILRSPRPGERRFDRTEVERQELVERRAIARRAPQPLLLGIALDECDPLRGAAGEAEVRDRLVVDREDRGRGPELGAHVADRRAIGQ